MTHADEPRVVIPSDTAQIYFIPGKVPSVLRLAERTETGV